MIEVGVVILNWNGFEDTIDCLKSINKLNLKGINLHCLVVDNASGNNSVVEIKKTISSIKNIKVIVLENDSNLGFAGGNNVGIDYLIKKNTDHILVLNNDTLVDRNFIRELVLFAEKNKGYGIISPKIYFAKGYEYHKDRYENKESGKVIWAAGGYMDWDNVFGKNRGVDEVDEGQYDKSEEIDFASGAAILLSNKLLKSIGTFDDRYFMYFEDADLIQRAKISGFINYYVPKAKVWHKVAQSSAIGGNLNDYFITRNRLLFGTMYAPLKTKVALYRESFRLALSGRKWQRLGAMDFYLRKFSIGSWKNN